MTSEEYATRAQQLVQTAGGDSPGATRLRVMLHERITGQGRAEYEVDADVQSVEVKPLDDLVRDVREELTDLAAYAAAATARVDDPDVAAASYMLAMLAVQGMNVADRLQVALTEATADA